MANLTFYRPNGDWGIEGVDLSTLPPKVYGALCKLHDLEHKEDMAIEHLAKMCGIPEPALDAYIHLAKLKLRGDGEPTGSFIEKDGMRIPVEVP